MRISRFLLITIFVILIAGCSENHLINDKAYRKTVEARFEEKQKLASNRKDALFNVFNEKLSLKRSEALKFLFAFMPLNDLADYSGEFFLANADIALEALRNTPWGNNVPEDIFLHYVLPPRVNNENLDSFRIVFAKEISVRIAGLSLTEAALEINHWCHEKVTYQPSDIRTSSPMSTILSARGRCGEESTFTVSALRAAGIPARQVYTPRWAHSDDNHAWIEIWNDGTWYYMGACEPEPALDQGWFTEPARRAMLIHSKSFGAHYGNENIIKCSDDYCEVNALSKYAVTKNIFVKVADKDYKPVENAAVEFQLYNYAEFYPLTVVNTNQSGICRFETGLGDLLVWARKGDNFNYKKITVEETDTLSLILNRSSSRSDTEIFDLKAPVLRSPLKGASAEDIKKNAERLKQENEIRQNYIDSWIKPADAYRLAASLNLDTAVTATLLAKSMGNYKTVTAFLVRNAVSFPEDALSLLNVISEKDLRDSKTWILEDHLKNAANPFSYDTKDEIYTNYILNPRVANEMLTAYRGYFIPALSPEFRSAAIVDPSEVVKYINETVRVAEEENYYKTPVSPKGVFDLRLADSKSRAIYFVALNRTLGIPSRLEPGSNIPQYFFNSRWNDVYFYDEKRPFPEKGFLKLTSSERNPVPEYYLHFTLARFENGRYNTLEYDENRRVTDFKEELALTRGHYMVVTGNRLDDSRVLSDISFFDLNEGEHLSFDIKIRKDSQPEKFDGTVNMDKLISWLNENNAPFGKNLSGPIVLAGLEPDKEPSKHVLNDLPLLKTELDNYGTNFIIFSSDSSFNPVESGNYKGLPSRSASFFDSNLKTFKTFLGSDSSSFGNLPLIILTDRGGNILYRSSGYKIGIGEQILKRIRE